MKRHGSYSYGMVMAIFILFLINAVSSTGAGRPDRCAQNVIRELEKIQHGMDHSPAEDSGSIRVMLDQILTSLRSDFNREAAEESLRRLMQHPDLDQPGLIRLRNDIQSCYRDIRQLTDMDPAERGPGRNRFYPVMQNVVKPDFQVNENEGRSPKFDPAVACGAGGHAVVVWEDDRNDDDRIAGQIFYNNYYERGTNFTVEGDYSYGREPDVALDDAGNFVVVFYNGRDIVGQRYDENGNETGGIFEINDSEATNENDPKVAMNGDGQFVVVWRENRNSDYDIYGQLFNADGTAAGGNFRVNDDTGDGSQSGANVGMDDSGNFVVVWQDDRVDEDRIYFQRFSSTGVALGSNTIAAEAYEYNPGIAVGRDGRFIIAWLSASSDDNIEVQRYSSSGSPVGSQISLFDQDDQDATIAPMVVIQDDGSFAVILRGEESWQGDEHLYIQHFSASGTPQGACQQVTGYSNSYYSGDIDAAMGPDGHCAVVWVDERNLYNDIYGQWYDPDGDDHGSNRRINDDEGSSEQHYPRAASDGSGNVFVVWEDKRTDWEQVTLYGQRYDPNMNWWSSNFEITDYTDEYGDAENPDVAVDGSGNALVVWEDYRDGDYSVYGQRYSGGTAVGGNFPVFERKENTYYSNSQPAVSMNTSGSHVVVWLENPSGQDYILYAQRYASTGQTQGSVIKVAEDQWDYSPYAPDVAVADDGSFAVVWRGGGSDNRDIYCQVYTAGGSQKGGYFVVNDDEEDDSQYEPAVAADENGRFIIVWEDYRDSKDIYGQVVDNSGTASGSNFSIVNDRLASPGMPSIAAGETGFVVVWEDGRGDYDEDIFGQRCDSDGNRIGHNFRIPVDTTSLGGKLEMPDVVMGADEFTVITVWEELRTYGQNWDIFANVIDISDMSSDTAAAPVFDPQPGTFTSAVNVTITSETAGASIYYTTDGSEPDESGSLYSSAVSLTATTTLKAKSFKSGWKSSGVTEGLYTIMDQVATPGFDPPPGIYNTPQTVSMTCATEDAVIYYTSDGTDPSDSDMLYVGPVAVPRTATLKAVATKSGWVSSDIATGEFVIDYQGISIVHTPPEYAAFGQDVSLEISVGSDSGIAEVLLYYAMGGAEAYFPAAMTSGGSTWNGTIPAASVTERGVKYFFMVSDTVGNKKYDPDNALQERYTVPVVFSGLTCPDTTPAGSYRMISVPVDLTNKNPASILADDLGNHDRSEWRLIHDNGESYEEYGMGSVPDFSVGRGFWLITRTDKAWAVGAGQSVSPDESYSMTLQPGWNQVGHPFAFAVDWSDVVTTAGNVEPPVGYTGTGNSTSGYRYNQLVMEPWQGYYIRNLESSPVTIGIPARAFTGARKAPAWESLVRTPGDWVVRITAEGGSASDCDNYFGCLAGSREEWDSLDLSEAPPFGDYVSLAFPHREWERYPGMYTADFRASGPEGHIWEFDVQTSLRNTKITLRFHGLADLAPDQQLVLVDGQTGIQVILNDIDGEYQYVASSSGEKRSFELLAGSGDFLSGRLGNDAALLPESTRLLQNFPNPFNLCTTIHVQLDRQAHVHLVLRNLLGQTICVFRDEMTAPGHLVFVWDGKDRFGRVVPAGIYLLALHTEAHHEIRKIVMVK